MGLTKHPDKPKGECVMEFRDKPMQNLIRIKEKEICKNEMCIRDSPGGHRAGGKHGRCAG